MFGEELFGEFPWRIAHHFVHISTMSDRFVAFGFVHNSLALIAMGQSVTVDTDDEVDVVESVLGLEKLSCVASVEHVVDAVGVDPDLAADKALVGGIDRHFDAVITIGQLFERVLVVAESGRF